MDILILGNGFDIAHDLKTTYGDFLKYCIKKFHFDSSGGIKNYTQDSDNVWLRHFYNNQNLSINKWIDFENEIYEVIQSVHRNLFNITRGYKNPYFKKIYNYSELFVRTDFDLKKFVSIIENIQTRYECNSKGYIFVSNHIVNNKSCYFEHCLGVINFLYDQLRDFTEMFERYLKEEVLSNMDNTHKYNLCINSKCVSLLNFNYTDTCERLYKINFNHNDCGIRTQAVYVHGNLVLGTYSFDNEEIPTGFNVFRKHNQRHRYATIEKYQDLLNELKYPKKRYIPTFHIIGHSLDKSDHNILKHILLARDNSRINIYYHDQDVLERLINNITDIIGEEEVMSKVRFIHQHNDERSILKEINPT